MGRSGLLATASQQNWIEVDFTLVCLDPYTAQLTYSVRIFIFPRNGPEVM